MYEVSRLGHTRTVLYEYKLRFRDPLLRIHNREGAVEKRHVSVTLRLDGDLLFPVWANVYTRPTELSYLIKKHTIPGQVEAFADSQTSLQKKFCTFNNGSVMNKTGAVEDYVNGL